MDEEITNERLFLEARKNHRRLVAGVAGITIENLLIVGVLADFFSPLEAGVVLAGFLFLTMVSVSGMKSGGVSKRINDKLLRGDGPEPESEVERRVDESQPST